MNKHLKIIFKLVAKVISFLNALIAAKLSNKKIILNLPGSPGGVMDGLLVSEPLFDHIFKMISGNTEH